MIISSGRDQRKRQNVIKKALVRRENVDGVVKYAFTLIRAVLFKLRKSVSEGRNKENPVTSNIKYTVKAETCKTIDKMSVWFGIDFCPCSGDKCRTLCESMASCISTEAEGDNYIDNPEEVASDFLGEVTEVQKRLDASIIENGALRGNIEELTRELSEEVFKKTELQTHISVLEKNSDWDADIASSVNDQQYSIEIEELTKQREATEQRCSEYIESVNLITKDLQRCTLEKKEIEDTNGRLQEQITELEFQLSEKCTELDTMSTKLGETTTELKNILEENQLLTEENETLYKDNNDLREVNKTTNAPPETHESEGSEDSEDSM